VDRAKLNSPSHGLAALIGVALLAGQVGGCSRCSSAHEPERPNLLLITLDTTRQDRLGAYGSTLGVTPNLDRLAAEGVVFRDARTEVPTTLASHTTIFTGLGVREHGIRENGAEVDDSVTTLAEILERRGFRTAAFVSGYVLDGRFGLEQGFDTYDDEMTHAWEKKVWQGHRVPKFERRADETTDRAVEWLADNAARKGSFFAWVHYFDPHRLWNPPKRWLDRAAHPYDGEVGFMDEQIGRLVAALEGAGQGGRRTLLLAVSDHGESVGEHDIEGHGQDLYEPAMRAVWIMRQPGVLPADRRIEDRVVLTDVAATALDLLGLDPGAVAGKSVRKLWEGGSDRAKSTVRPSYMETLVPALRFDKSAVFGLLVGDLKLIHWPADRRVELYDIAADPRELRDLSRRDPLRTASMRAELEQIVRGDASSSAPRPVEMDPEVEEKLRALGYIGGKGAERAAEAGP
jgi:arylsulfatase A-like enzyme